MRRGAEALHLPEDREAGRHPGARGGGPEGMRQGDVPELL